MGSTQLNNEMNLQYPDDFKIMSEEELRKHKFYEEAPGFCINDPDRHIVLSVSWRQANPFVAMLAGTKEVAQSMESKIRKPMRRQTASTIELVPTRTRPLMVGRSNRGSAR